MLRIQDIDLRTVFTRYGKITDFQSDGGGRYKCVCPFHNDTHPSLLIYDKTSVGAGWDYHCFACGAHGGAVTALVELHKAQTEEEAVRILRRDFEISYPKEVTLEGIADIKGIDPALLKKNGWVTQPDGVDIPYLDTAGNVIATKVRCKYEGNGDKFFFRGKSNDSTPYGLHWLDRYEDDIIYITEGETDCMTMKQAGLPVLGIAGARGFKEEYVTYIRRFKSIVIVRDNDEAGWGIVDKMSEFFPDNLYMVALPNGVKDINNFHQYRCNSNPILFTENFSKLPILPATPMAFIAAVSANLVLPTDKLCWDMVVRCLHEESERLYYKEQFCKETKTSKTLVGMCLKSAKANTAKVQEDGDFVIIDGSYYKEVYRDSGMVQVRVTNFVINPQFDVIVDGEVTRVVDLVNCEGRVAHRIYFDSDTLSSTSKFNQRCLASGNYIFTGEQQDLFRLCYAIFSVPKDTVYSPRMIGRVAKSHWLFENCGVNSQGEIVPIEDGIVKLDGTAYKPRGISITDSDGDTGNSTDMPHIDYELLATLDVGYRRDMARYFRGTFGTMGAWVGLGWVVAGWFSSDIFEKFGFFPYLFVTGKRASGKSVFCTLLQSAFGFNPNQAGMSIESPTNVGIIRYLSYRSSLPQWYDDYRNGVHRIQMKDNLLLDAYNRHGSVKGTKEGGVVSDTVNGFLLLSGEDIPSNNALLTRCHIVTLSAYERDASMYEECRHLFESLPSQGLKWASDAASGNTEELLSIITELKLRILEASGDIRDASNKAIFGGAFLYGFGDAISSREREEFVQYLCNASTSAVDASTQSHPMMQFFDDFTDLGLIRGFDYSIEGDTIHIRIKSCHAAWEQRYKGIAPLSKAVLKAYIEKEPFYAGESRRYFDRVGRQRCLAVDIKKMGAEFDDFMEFIVNQQDSIDY